jgi:maltose O-acetyltransferase
MPDRSEREKMLAGEPYLAADPELAALRARARRLARRYNATTEEERERRRELLAELFGSIGAYISIEPPFHCDYGANITAGTGLFMNFGCVILDCAAVRLGEDVQCGPYVQLLTAYHPTDPAARRSGPELAAPITIGDNVWLGGGVIVCPGVTIGANTTIGAGSVVTRDIPANVIAAGNPCRVIRELP